MAAKQREYLRYRGESPQDVTAFREYLADVKRGKSLLQLRAIQLEMTPEIRESWSARSFTPVVTPEGVFDEIICNASYHFNKHGSRFGSITVMTNVANDYFQKFRDHAVDNGFGLLRFPNGSLYEPDGRIVTFLG